MVVVSVCAGGSYWDRSRLARSQSSEQFSIMLTEAILIDWPTLGFVENGIDGTLTVFEEEHSNLVTRSPCSESVELGMSDF